MKKTLAILLIIVLGIALGVGIAAWRIRTSRWDPTRDEGGRDAAPSNSGTSGSGQDRAGVSDVPVVPCLAVVE